MQVVTGEEMKEVDRYAIQEIGIKEEILMENAGRAVAQEVMDSFSYKEQKIAVFIGKGNNGGDGFAAARVMLDHGADVDVFLVAEEDKFKGAALYHKQLFERCGYEWSRWPCPSFNHLYNAYDLIIDALLGTGVKGTLRSPYKEAVSFVNKSSAKVVSVDIPSGIPSGEEEVSEHSVRADLTIAIQNLKCSAYLYPAKSYYGEVRTVDIGIGKVVQERVNSKRKIWVQECASRSLPPRSLDSHKGSNGKGLLIGGAETMPGAVSLAASACLRSGAGLLTTAVPTTISSTVSAQVPETTLMPLPEKDGVIAGGLIGTDFDLNAYDAVAAGPGLSRNEAIKPLIRRLLTDMRGPLLFDADALYYLPELGQMVKQRNEPLIITPHPGEMARLTGETAGKVNRYRFEISRQYAMEMGCFVVLKGPYTIVTAPDGEQFINTTGNEALARGGTGDVLTGVMLSLLLQGGPEAASIINAVYLHGLTADLAVEKEKHSYAMTASDFIHLLPLAFRSIVSSL